MEDYADIYYKDGLKHGLYKTYYKINRRLECIGEYTNDKPSGTWYYFLQTSHLSMIEKDIRENKTMTVLRNDNQIVKPKFQSYLTCFYPNGQIKEEGIALYNEDVQVFFFRSKNWKCYDRQGKIIKCKQK